MPSQTERATLPGFEDFEFEYPTSSGLTRQVFKRGSVALHYQYTDYQSTQPGFTYDSNQVGLELNYSY